MKARTLPYALAVLLAGIILRAWLIVRWPIIFGGDTILRMANRDHILLSYQLPALQASLHYLAAISDSAAMARYFMGLIGAAAGVGFYLLAAHFVDRKRAFLAALLFVSNPFLLALSTVPYQEILMLAALFFAFHFFLSGELVWASLSFGLACLTRYEAWAAYPVLVLALAIDRKWRASEVIKAALLFGWAPLAWMVYRGGVSPGGTYVLDRTVSLWRFMRYVYLGWITVKNTPIPVLLLAALGCMRLWKDRQWKQPGLLLLTAFMLLFLISIFFSAHGESPDTERFVTAREAHLPICAVLLLACFGLSRLTRLTVVLCALGFCLGVYGAGRFVARETSPANVQLSYDLARYLDNTLQDDEKAIILTKPIPPDLIQAYFDKVFEKGGAAALADARRVLRSMDTSPPEYQRTLVHSRLGKQRLLSFGGMAASELKESDWPHVGAEWVAVWSDFTPGNALEARIYEVAVKGRQPEQILRSGALAVSIYRVVLRARTRITVQPQPVAQAFLPVCLRKQNHSRGAENVRHSAAEIIGAAWHIVS